MLLINAYNRAIRPKFQLKYEMRDGKKTTLLEVILLCPMILKLCLPIVSTQHDMDVDTEIES